MATTLSTDGQYVILVRHAKRDHGTSRDESKQSMAGWTPSLVHAESKFETEGLPRTLAFAHRLVDELGNVKVARIWHSPHIVAAQTAEAYAWGIRARTQRECSPEPIPNLDPDTGSADSVATHLRPLTTSGTLEAGSAILLVGHQPMLTVLARALAGRRLPAGTLPLGSSEVACLEMRNGRAVALLWMLTEKPPGLRADLKDKIKSKYDVAKFFLGAFVVNAGFLLSSTVWGVQNAWAKAAVLVGFVLPLVALALTAAPLVSYDALLMPTEFWTGASAGARAKRQSLRPKPWSVLRPPSQDQIVLFYEM